MYGFIILQMVVISQEAMKLAIASSLRSYQQILILFSLNVDNLPMPEKSDAGKIITSGGYEIFRSRIVKKKIGKLSAPEVQSVFMVNIYNLFGFCYYKIEITIFWSSINYGGYIDIDKALRL